MRFKDWLNDNMIKVKSVDDIPTDLNFVNTNLYGVQNVYNILKNTTFLDDIKIYYTDNGSIFHYYICNGAYSYDLDAIYSMVRFLNKNAILNFISEEIFIRAFICGRDIHETDTLYFLLTLNPTVYSAEYIKKVESILNKNITICNTVKGLYKEFMNLIRTDDQFRNFIQSTYDGFGILSFKTKKEYDSYIQERNEVFSECNVEQEILSGLLSGIPSDNINVIKVDSLDEAKELKTILTHAPSTKLN